MMQLPFTDFNVPEIIYYDMEIWDAVGGLYERPFEKAPDLENFKESFSDINLWIFINFIHPIINWI